MTPFRALFGFEAPSAVSDALAISTAPMEEPLERAALFTSSSIRDRINQAQQKVHEAAQRDARKAARGRTEFSPGEYVLVFHEAARKLDRVWTGPFLIDSRLTAVTYAVRSLMDGSVRRVHVNRLHSFDAGELSTAQLHMQARRVDEYDLEAVVGHRYNSEGDLVLRVLWDGYEPYDADDERAWCPYAQCSGQDCVKEYVERLGLAPMCGALAQKRGKRGGRKGVHGHR